jgi:hypothetical protein
MFTLPHGEPSTHLEIIFVHIGLHASILPESLFTRLDVMRSATEDFDTPCPVRREMKHKRTSYRDGNSSSLEWAEMVLAYTFADAKEEILATAI